MDLKQILKIIKLNESKISTFFGILVILAVAFFIYTKVDTISQNQKTLTGSNTSLEQEGKEVYKVQKGDTLWKLAEKYYSDGFKWELIAKENNISNPKDIKEGQELVISKEKTEKTDQNEKETPQTVTVEKGDTLWDLAVTYYGTGYRWTDIAKENHLTNPQIIHQGNVLKLPPK